VNELAVLDDDDATGTSSHVSNLDGLATLSLPGFIRSIHGILAGSQYAGMETSQSGNGKVRQPIGVAFSGGVRKSYKKFASEDRYVGWGLDADPYSIAVFLQHRDRNVRVDLDLLTGLPG
jgi:hypothetical protein